MKKRLIFIDEFDKGYLDETKWGFEVGGFGWGNNEKQLYTTRNISFENNHLNIIGKKEKTEKNDYTSSKLTTYNKHHFKYGSFRIKCKIPLTKGSWPAVWMMPVDFKNKVRWPLCGEIDIMEHVTSHMGDFYFSLHTETHNFRKSNQRHMIVSNPKWTSEFTEFGIDWTKDYIRYFVNDKEVACFLKGDFDEVSWPFDKEFYLILNYAIGGDWPGEVADDFSSDRFEIEYVKVYEFIDEE